MPVKPVIGLLGGIASGKTSVARMLAREGGYVVSADEIAHRILDEADVRARLTARFGKQIRGPDGRIDRARLAQCAFRSREAHQALNAIVHPPVLDEIRREIASAQRDEKVDFIVLDAALLLEAGQQDLCDLLIFVEADPQTRSRRLASYRNWPPGEMERRESLQLPLERKREMADFVIENNGSLEDLEREVKALVRRLANPPQPGEDQARTTG